MSGQLIASSLRNGLIQKACIIGAGVAGLQTARALQRIGIKHQIYEKSPSFGGVWRENYINCGLQARYEHYQFPEYILEEHYNGDKKIGHIFPPSSEVQEYIMGYYKKFKLEKVTQYNSEVIKLEQMKEGKWRVFIKDTTTQTINKELFDLIVIATGMYNTPYLPDLGRREDYKGNVYHSSQVLDESQIQNKKCVVVGGAKSAYDLAVECSKYGEKSTNIFRKAHWMFPRLFLGIIPAVYIAATRFLLLVIVPSYYKLPPKSRFKKSLLSLYWKQSELLMRVQHRMRGPRIPDLPIVQDAFEGAGALDNSYRDACLAGKISVIKDQVVGYDQDGVICQTGQKVPADVVIFATGFTKNYGYFSNDVKKLLDLEFDGHWLYKQILPTSVSNLAFIGAETAAYCNTITFYLQAEWLAGCITGKVTLPDDKEMLADLTTMKKWRRSFVYPSAHRACQLQAHQQAYHDELVKDLGYPAKRKSNAFAETFSVYTGCDYTGVCGQKLD